MKILIILPVATNVFNEGIGSEAKSVAAPDTEISVINLDRGPQTIESRYEEFWATADLIEKSQAAQKNGVDGIFIACFGEPGVETIRELVEIPVVGGFDPAVLTASIISQKFSIITVEKRVISMLETLARDLGITDNIASIIDVGIPVEELSDKERLKEALVKQSLKAIDRDGAQAIVLGCTGMLDVAKAVQQILAELGKPAPVIDPTTTAVTFLQSLIRNQLSQSRLTYYKVDLPSSIS
jgi:allantoin racemase